MQVTLVFHNAPTEVQRQVRNLEIVPETDTLRLELQMRLLNSSVVYDWSDVKELRVEP